MRKIVDALHRFNAAARHWEARHPVAWAAVYVSCLEAIWIPFGAVPTHPIAAAIVFFVVLVAMLGALQRYLWRPGGMKRNGYERWCEQQGRPDYRSGAPFPPDWYLDATGRHRLRYWDGCWTAWVADAGDAFLDDGASVAARFGVIRPTTRRTGPAHPLLLGLTIGALLGSAAIVAAFAFPHPIDVPFGSIGSSQRLGGIWLATAGAIAAGAATSIVFGWRTPLRISAPDTATTPSVASSTTVAFGRALGATLGIGAVSAWPTWIQGWPAICALGVLTALVGIAVVAAIFAVKVSRFERTDHTGLLTQGLVPTLRGLFLAPSAL